jgi:catechol 2,3-dioxygenase-like lactoylglutathione lyase family enzyme
MTTTAADPTPLPIPRAITHVGLSVPDIHAAVQWYCSVLGFRTLSPPMDVDRSDPIAADVFGERFQRMRIAHLASGNGCALELFEFVDPPAEPPRDNFAYWEIGFFHICVTDPNVAELAAQIDATGGKIRGSRVWEMVTGTTGSSEHYLTIYCEDPFGNIIEILSHSHEHTFANTTGPPLA